MDRVLTNGEKRDLAIASRDEIVGHLPSEMTLAATDRCNLRCVTCGTHHAQSGDNNAGLADVPRAMTAKLAGMTAGAERIQLHGGGGEPMMSRSFWQWLALFSADPRASIEFNTNGLLLTDRAIARLLDHRVSVISISCDAATPETYRKIRGADFGRLLKNIRALLRARAQRGVSGLTVSLNFTVTLANVADAPLLVQLAHELGADGVEFYQLNAGDNYGWRETRADGTVFDYRDNLPQRRPDVVAPLLAASRALADRLGIALTIDPRLRYLESGPDTAAAAPAFVDYSACTNPWRWLNVGVNGDVYPCSMATTPLGNLRDVDNLSEIWNGATMQTLRRNVAANTVDRKICRGGSCAYVMKDTFQRNRDAEL